jgi:hypothetical protein
MASARGSSAALPNIVRIISLGLGEPGLFPENSQIDALAAQESDLMTKLTQQTSPCYFDCKDQPSPAIPEHIKQLANVLCSHIQKNAPAAGTKTEVVIIMGPPPRAASTGSTPMPNLSNYWKAWTALYQALQTQLNKNGIRKKAIKLQPRWINQVDGGSPASLLDEQRQWIDNTYPPTSHQVTWTLYTAMQSQGRQLYLPLDAKERGNNNPHHSLVSWLNSSTLFVKHAPPSRYIESASQTAAPTLRDTASQTDDRARADAASQTEADPLSRADAASQTEADDKYQQEIATLKAEIKKLNERLEQACTVHQDALHGLIQAHAAELIYKTERLRRAYQSLINNQERQYQQQINELIHQLNTLAAQIPPSSPVQLLFPVTPGLPQSPQRGVYFPGGSPTFWPSPNGAAGYSPPHETAPSTLPTNGGQGGRHV